MSYRFSQFERYYDENRDRLSPEETLDPEEEALMDKVAQRFAKLKPDHRDYNLGKPVEYSPDDARRLAAKQSRNTQAENKGERHQIGLVWEYIVWDAIKHGWLGENVRVSRTSECDDELHGLDLALQLLNDQGEVLGYLGIDLAVSTENIGQLINKLSHIQIELNQLHLGNLSYYYSTQERRFVEIQDVPRVVISINHQTLSIIAESFNKALTDETQDERLNKHSLQLEIIDEILSQLSKQIEIVKEKFKTASAENLSRLETILDKLETAARYMREVEIEKENPQPQGQGVQVKRGRWRESDRTIKALTDELDQCWPKPGQLAA